MEMSRVPSKLAAARLRAVDLRPYYAAAIFAMPVYETDKIPTMAVDQWCRLYFNTQFLKDHTVEELAGVVIHEVEHILRDHCCRRAERDPNIWNIAADCEINDDLRDQRIPLPEGGCYPDSFGLKLHKMGEEYYVLLDKMAIKIVVVAGSCSDGVGKGWELPDPGEDGPGLSKGDRGILRRRVARAVIEEAGRDPGSVPGDIRRWADSLLEAQVDWRKELASLIRNALGKVRGMVDYSYQRPSRRQSISKKVILPALVKPQPKVAAVVDTSGSMGDEELAQGLAELKGVIRSLGIGGSLVVLSVDAAVHTCKTVFSENQIELVGGGGTDMGAGIAAASQLRPRPEVIIVYTDGYTPWPSNPPMGSKVVVCCCTADGETPTWAKTVRVKPKGPKEPRFPRIPGRRR